MAALSSTYNTGIVWGTHNQPFQTDITGGNDSGYSQTLEADISDTNITASTLSLNFRTYANLLSRIRYVKLQKWYQNGGDVRSSLQSEETQVTNLKSDYGVDPNTMLAGATAADTVVTASALDAFVTTLSTTIQTNRNATVTIEEFYCHSNCHGSCHGSL
jgi:hypothetical protein